MKFKVLASAFLFLCSFQLLSQGRPDNVAKPFEDYALCLTGFNTSNGALLWDAQFESFQWITSNVKTGYRYYWLVNKDGKYGLLTHDGLECLPFIYDEIIHLPNGNFAVQKDSLFGIINEKNEEIKPFEYERFKQIPRTSFFEIHKNQKVGILDSSYRLVVPTEYSSIKPHVISKYCSDPYESGCFIVERKNRTGVLDLQGNELVPCKFAQVEVVHTQYRCASSPLFF